MFVARILTAPCSRAMKLLPQALPLRFLEHKMGRVFRSLVFCYGESQRTKVQTIEQRLALTKKNGGRHDMERVDQAGSQILPHRGHAASDLDVFAAGSIFREIQRLLETARHKVEGGSTFHHHRFTLIMRKNEGRCVVRRIVTPPALP